MVCFFIATKSVRALLTEASFSMEQSVEGKKLGPIAAKVEAARLLLQNLLYFVVPMSLRIVLAMLLESSASKSKGVEGSSFI